MNKSILFLAGLTLATLMTGCQGASTGSSVTPTSVSGVAAFRSGTASALTFDSSVVASSTIDSNGHFEIRLPEGIEAAFVRADSGHKRFFGLIPRDHKHRIVVDSASHAVLDSIREAHHDARELSEDLWDSLRIRHEAKDHHNDADSMEVEEPEHSGKSDSTEVEHHKLKSDSIPEIHLVSDSVKQH